MMTFLSLATECAVEVTAGGVSDKQRPITEKVGWART